jgi:hypothetical protein
MYYHTQQPLRRRHWLKWLAVVDLQRRLILAQAARQAPWNDCANLPELLAHANAHTPIGCVLADAEFDSERNHTFVPQRLHALSVIPAKRGKRTWRIHGVRAQMRANFRRGREGRATTQLRHKQAAEISELSHSREPFSQTPQSSHVETRFPL